MYKHKPINQTLLKKNQPKSHKNNKKFNEYKISILNSDWTMIVHPLIKRNDMKILILQLNGDINNLNECSILPILFNKFNWYINGLIYGW